MFVTAKTVNDIPCDVPVSDVVLETTGFEHTNLPPNDGVRLVAQPILTKDCHSPSVALPALAVRDYTDAVIST